MARVSPLHKLHHQAEAAILPYVPAGASPDQVVEVVGSYGDLELEYAAIRKGCILIDEPHRGLLEVAGPDRLDFLNRMLTQELKGFEPFQVRRSFWLNRKGRIDADLTLIALPDRILMDVDIHAADRAVKGLAPFIVTEDVTITEVTERYHRLALHGPTSASLLAAVTRPTQPTHDRPAGTPVADLRPDRASLSTFESHDLLIFRDDFTGEPGFELILPVEATAALFHRLIEIGGVHDHEPTDSPQSKYRLRPAGWHAVNIARLEAGRPVYNLDFGPDSLPAETGVLHDRVSFTKGCYLGQEIVARMHARGHPKRQLVALKMARLTTDFTPEGVPPTPRQPDTGAAVFLASVASSAPTEPAPPSANPAQLPDDPAQSSGKMAMPSGDPIGAITSSAISPMLGAAPIAFAQVKYEHTKPTTSLAVEIDEITCPAIVQPTLTFWSRSAIPT